MADFVAVIRRAVDGLANNTPDMRLRVYDKARGAVQRQLENMKPRPSDEMLRRQMDKLEAAITSVEAEHAEALPALEPEVVPAFAADVAEPPPPPVEEPVAPAPETVQDDAASSYGHSAYEHEAYTETDKPSEPETSAPDVAPYEPPVEQADELPTVEHYGADDSQLPTETVDRDAREDVARDPYHAAPAEPEVPRWDEPAAASSYEDQSRTHDVSEPTYDAPADDRDRLVPMPETDRNEAAGWPQDPDAPQSEVVADDREPVFGADHGHADVTPAPRQEPSAYDLIDTHSPQGDKASAEQGWTWPQPSRSEPEPAAAAPEPVAVPAWVDPVELPRHGEETPAAAPVPGDTAGDRHRNEAFDAHFDAPVTAAATAKMPAVSDLPDYHAAPADKAIDDNDPFSDYLRPQSTTTTAVEGAAVDQAGAKPADPDPWNDLEELIGYNKAAADAAANAPAGQDDDLHDDMMPPPVRPYRVAPKPKRRFGPILLAVLGLVIVGGGAYAAWSNSEAIENMVGQLLGSNGSDTSDTAQQTPPASGSNAAGTQTPATPTNPATAPATGQAANGTPGAAAPAADGTAAGQKFTQRLMANGSEVDEGAGGPPAGGAGQSVAQLNSPPGTPAATPPTAQAPANTPAANPPANAPAVNPADTAAVSGEKMFLYEERLGQTAPTAVEGSVSWSLQREPGENGREEPVVQGRINVPGRGLTALVTFKRNSDASLPASHLIELVFSVPADFEGGAIDSVQRIAMKDTEQDRGTPLVAVPAKITDDFHMIALNDFPDARATNIELLRSKNWLDIPLAYRNGRRALLTLQKGPDGVKAFDTAIREWSTLPPSAGQ